MDAGDEELRLDIERLERLALGGAIFLLVGLAVEIWFAAFPLATEIARRVGDIIATVIVGVGVGAEVVFGKMASNRQGELVDRSNKTLARLTAENTALLKRVFPRRFDRPAFVRALSNVPRPDERIGILYMRDNPECLMLSMAFADVFEFMGWPHSYPVPIVSPDVSNVHRKYPGGRLQDVSVLLGMGMLNSAETKTIAEGILTAVRAALPDEQHIGFGPSITGGTNIRIANTDNFRSSVLGQLIRPCRQRAPSSPVDWISTIRGAQ